MNAEVLREASATTALHIAQAVRAGAYLSHTTGAIHEDIYQQLTWLANAVESLAKAVLGLEDSPPPDLRVIYGETE